MNWRKHDKKGVSQDGISMTQPFVIKKYNEGMGGIDVMDHLLGSYRPNVSAKKWVDIICDCS